ncbi:MAG TPA: molybdate ABC transporter permease subunit [Vicinamibacterales bacterium]|nr:molybdate ABC transporter permease subunit [Vicinamibacterales bacterium]
MEQTTFALAAFTTLMGVCATLVAMPVGVAAAWVLARRSFPGKVVVETTLTLPLVLPPVATGFLLLQLFGLNSIVGRALDAIGLPIVFTWRAVVVAMAVMSFPLIVLTARAGLEQVDRRYEQVASTLGAGPWRVFRTITLPLAARSLVAAAILGFARALGEFGATIIIAGGIPGQTQTLSVAIFNLTEAGRDSDATRLLLVSAGLAFGAMILANLVQRERRPL